MPFTEDWYSEVQLGHLCELATRTNGLGPHWAVEVGCWQGRSTVALANALAPATLHVVDHWQGNADTPYTQDVARARDVYAEFCENIRALTAGNVCVHRMDWAEFAARDCQKQLRFVHLDGPHDEESVGAQIRFFAARLVPGGILCGDDYAAYPAVNRAVRAYAPEAQANGNFWWLVKP